MAKRLAELGALQDAVSNNESNPSRLGLAGYIRGLFLDWSANPYNPLTRLSARGRLLGYFWDNGAIGLSMDFANQNFIVKDGTLQSKPFSDIVNFSRTSNATVTDSAGVITYAPHNLLTFSEQFDNAAITKVRATITANSTTAPNGTITADKLIEDSTAANTHACYFTATTLATSYVFSVDVKAAERTWVVLGHSGKTAFFNLATGVLGNVDAGATATITASANGFYRCTLAATATAGSTLALIYLATANGTNSYNGNGASGVHLWGAQLEIGSIPTTYNSTTVKNLLGFSELFDNAAWTKSNSFVQTNLLTYSEAFDNAAWTKALSSISANVITSPNGYQTGDKLIASASSGVHNLSQGSFNLPIASFSIYAKKGEYNFCTLIFIGGGIRATRTFNLTTGEITNPYDVSATTISATATDVGDGWYKLNLSSTSTSFTAVNIALAVDTVNNHTFSGQTFTGDGTSGIYLWGAQVVQGATAGDYRRTDAAALPVYYANHNGVVCAEKLVENTATSEHRIQVTPTLGTAPITASIYFKASERSWAFIRLDDSISVKYAYFNLSTGIVGTVTAGLTASIVNAGNGWYRCSATFNAPSAGSGGILFAPTTGNGTSSYTGNGTSGIYIFGAQVSDSASLDPYVLNVATAPSAAAYYGARFDYDPVTLAPKGLLIEEQRANLLLNSSLAGTNLATQSVTVTAVAHTLSFYGTGTVTLTGTANTSLVGTGAYPTRSTLTFTPTAGVVLFTVTGTVQYAQLEIGSFATSFIPTAASQVTRTADVASIQGSNFYSWINQDAGSVYSQFVTPASGNRNIIALDDNTANNNIRLRTEGTNPFLKQAWVGTEQVALDLGTVAANTEYKISAAYQINDYAGVIANGTVGTDTVANTPIMVMLRLGTDQAGAYLNGTIKSLSYYPTRLNNDTLKGLTA